MLLRKLKESVPAKDSRVIHHWKFTLAATSSVERPEKLERAPKGKFARNRNYRAGKSRRAVERRDLTLGNELPAKW